MKIAFGERRGAEVQIRYGVPGGVNGSRPGDGSDDDFAALVVPRTDCDVKTVELPPVSERELPGLLRYRMRSLYPGHPERSELDYVIQRAGRKQVAVVFMAPGRVVDAYRERAGSRLLLTTYHLARAALGPMPRAKRRRGEDATVIVLQPSWMEVMRFEQGLLASSDLIPRAEDTALEKVVLQRAGPGRTLVLAAEPECGHLAALLGDARIELASLDAVAAHLPRRSPGAFNASPKRRRRLSLTLAIPLTALAVASLAVADRWQVMAAERAALAALRGQLATVADDTARRVVLQRRRAVLVEELQQLRARRGVDQYAVLAELTRIMPADVEVLTLTIDGATLQIEALAANPLALMERFNDTRGFSSVRLQAAAPEPGQSRERFRLTAVVDHGA